MQAWHGDLGLKLQELQEFHFKNTGGYCENTGDPNLELNAKNKQENNFFTNGMASNSPTAIHASLLFKTIKSWMNSRQCWNESNLLDLWIRLPWTRGYLCTRESDRGVSFEVGPGPASPDWTRESRFTALIQGIILLLTL